MAAIAYVWLIGCKWVFAWLHKPHSSRFSQLVQAVQITMPFTIAVYMVRMYEAHAGRPVASTGDEQRVARLTGVSVVLPQRPMIPV